MESTRPTPNSTPSSTASSEEDDRRQKALCEHGELPTHIAAIMDGNGRWAKARNEPRYVGHHEGVSSVRDVTEACAQLGVEYLTLYTFSTENWERPEEEVNALMELLVHTVHEERETLMENDVRLRTIGDLSQLPEACQEAMETTKAETAGNERLTLTLALSYSGRWEILQTVRQIVERAQRGELTPEEITEDVFASFLDTAGLPDPDLLIRTGGEYRLSNFLLWQCAYTELFITEQYWPDFRREALYEAIRSFQDRDRRFGRVSPDVAVEATEA